RSVAQRRCVERGADRRIAVEAGVSPANLIELQLTQLPLQRSALSQKKRLRKFSFPEPLQIIEPELLWPRRRRSFLWLLLSVLWLFRAALACRGRCSTSGWLACSGRSTSWWRATRLTIGALPSFSRAARFTRRRAGRRRRDWLTNRRLWSLFGDTTPVCTRACRWRRARSLTLGFSTGTLRRNIRWTTRPRGHPPGFASRTGRNRRPSPRRS